MSESSIQCTKNQQSFARQAFQIELALLVAAFCWCAGSQAAWSQDTTDSSTSMEKTSDGWQIAISYYRSKSGKDAPVVVMLHKNKGNRLVWKNGLAERLNDKGYAVITVDLRHHGRSKSPDALAAAADQSKKKSKAKKSSSSSSLKKYDYARMITQDMVAVKKFIFEEHEKGNLNMNKMAIVATEMSSVIALNFAAADWSKKTHSDGFVNEQGDSRTPNGQDVQALVLLSPNSSMRGVTTRNAIGFLKTIPISVLVCVGTKDSLDKRQAKGIFDRMGGTHKKEGHFNLFKLNIKREVGMYYQPYEIKLRGTDLLGKGLRTERHIIGFLDEHLKKLDIPWRNRQSKA